MPDPTDNIFNHTSAIPGLVPDSPGGAGPRTNPFGATSYEGVPGTFFPSPKTQAPVTFRSKGVNTSPFTATVGGQEIRQGESPLEKRRRQELRDQFVLLQDKAKRVTRLFEQHKLQLNDDPEENQRELDQNIHTPLSLIQKAVHSRDPVSDDIFEIAETLEEYLSAAEEMARDMSRIGA